MFVRLQCWVDILKVFIMEYTYKHINTYTRTYSCMFRISSPKIQMNFSMQNSQLKYTELKY